jgi:hypothetical protein
MSLSNRVEKLERTTVGGGPCAMCERRAESIQSSPVMRAGFTEEPGDSYSLNCPGCGSPFTVDVVYVSRKGEA